MQLTVVGCGTASTHASTPASGILVRSRAARVLLDCGPGVVARLGRIVEPTELDAVVISHLHFDHYLDLAPLRYLLPWRGRDSRRPRVYLPPGGRRQLAAFETAMSERTGFFDDAMDILEFDPDRPVSVGDELELRFAAARHYVPAWSVVVASSAGSRVVYGGDTGPGDELVELGRGADLFIAEATLLSPDEDDDVRGHLTIDEAIDTIVRSGARRGLIVHYPWTRRAELERRAAAAGDSIIVGFPGLVLDVGSTPAGLPEPMPAAG